MRTSAARPLRCVTLKRQVTEQPAVTTHTTHTTRPKPHTQITGATAYPPLAATRTRYSDSRSSIFRERRVALHATLTRTPVRKSDCDRSR